MQDDSEETVSINRRVYTFDDINEQYAKDTVRKDNGCRNFVPKVHCDRNTAWNVLTGLFPVIKVIRNYKIKEYLLLDVLSGISAGFVHFPQGLALGILAGLSPVYGLYTTLFPVLFYVIFGTSRHVSFGSNAVLSLIVANILETQYGSPSGNAALNSNVSTSITTDQSTVVNFNLTTAPTILTDEAEKLLQMKAATAAMAGLVAGCFMLAMGILRLGFLTSYMSTSFVGGFTTAAAIHIGTSQVSKLLGIKVRTHGGAGKIVKIYIDIFSNIATINFADLITSVVCIITLILVKTCINDRFKTKLPFPVPIELLVVVVSTIISHFGKFHGNFDVAIVGTIPTGIPTPSLPDFSSGGKHIVDSIVIGILAFSMTISLAKFCCKTHKYTIDDNQELVAYGFCNALSSFFWAFPSCIGPPRTMVLSSMGAKTTLNGISTAVLIFGILMVLGQFFASLPVCVLGAVIVASMKDILLQFRDLPRLWRINVYDFIIWVVTCSISVLVDLDIGLAAGILVSIFTVVIQNQVVASQVIGVPDDDIVFIDQTKRPSVNHKRGIRIFRFNSALYFATAEKFKKQLFEQCVNPQKIPEYVPAAEVSENGNALIQICDSVSYVILDCSAFNYIDVAGVDILLQVVTEYKTVGVSVFLARCPKQFVKTLATAGFFGSFPRENVFHDIHDAWKVCRMNIAPTMEENASTDE